MNRARVSPPAEEPPRYEEQLSLEDAFARWQQELLGTLHFLVGNTEDARDALQEAFVKCWRHRDSLGDVQNLRAWIFRVAVNTARDLRQTAWRRRKRPLSNEETMVASTQPGPEAEAQHTEKLALVREALAQLRDEEKEVFLLRQNGELTYEQIAASLEIPVGTVKTRMRMALEKLRVAVGSR